MRKMRHAIIHRILIRSANWVGDAIMTTPAMKMIRYNFPKAHITLLAKPWVLPVFEHNPHVDRLMTYQAAGRHNGHLGVLRLARDLHAEHFDLAIIFQNAIEAALLTWLARVPRRLGFTTDGRTLLLTHRIRSWRGLKKGHLVDYYLGLLTGAGLSPVDRRLVLVLSDNEKRFARQMLADLGIAPNGPIIGINPGATYGTAKRWPADRFVELSRRLIRDQGARVLIFGGPGEARLGDRIADHVGQGCTNLCDRTSLRQAMALIGCCRAFVTNDSGLMHVAAALDIPQAAIIGPTDAVATGPANDAGVLLQAEGSCERAPCLVPHCPIDHRCMTAVSVNMVYDTVMSLLITGERR
jgi:heptosyltransferase-2